jgi:hypothetical protein
MQELMAAKQVRTQGQKRGTMYFAGGVKAKGAKKGERRGARSRAKPARARAEATTVVAAVR